MEKAALDELYSDFCRFDVDGSGKLNMEELEKFVDVACAGGEFDRESLLKDLKTLDGDADGKISWAEFRTLITGEDPTKAAAEAAIAEEKKDELRVD